MESVGTGTKIFFVLSHRHLVSRRGVLVGLGIPTFNIPGSYPSRNTHCRVGDFLFSFAAASQFLFIIKHELDGQIMEHEMRGTL